MRVTNDEARLLIYDIDIRAEKRFLSVKESRIHELCTDLLEARELIEKQEEIIKEMRNASEIIRDNTHNPAHTLTNLGLEAVTDSCNTLAIKILEKTKEYAE